VFGHARERRRVLGAPLAILLLIQYFSNYAI
jgi:hypothetical protein